MSVAWTQYTKWVLPEVPKAPNGIVIDAIRDAAIEFCKISRFYTTTTAAAAVLAATTPRSIAVTVPTGAKAYQPLAAVWHASGSDNTPLTAKSNVDFDSLVNGWRSSNDVQGTPEFFTMRAEAVLTIGPWPSANGTLDYVFSFIPSASSTDCTDALFDQHHQSIAMGAKGLLLKQNQVWANKQAGDDYWRDFLIAAANESARVDRGLTNAALTTRSEYM